MKILRVSLPIVVADERHCSNDCPGMSNDASRCRFFEQRLTWDKRRKSHGNERLEECKAAELPKFKPRSSAQPVTPPKVRHSSS